MCGDLDCVKALARQHRELTIMFGNIVMKTGTETELSQIVIEELK